MALVKKNEVVSEVVSKGARGVHAPVECCGALIVFDGDRYLQLDTYGSPDRKFKNRVSQTLQFDRESAGQLRALIDRPFPRN